METIREIFTDQIDDPEYAMRGELDREALFQLSDNIKKNGLINPITVRPHGSRFEVVAGHRRLNACRIAGLIKIQCVVRDLDDDKSFEVMAAENLERSDVDPVDESVFLSTYAAKSGKSVTDLAKALRRSVTYIENRFAISKMPGYMKTYLKLGQLKLGAALALVQITNEAQRKLWTDMAVRDGVSVAQAEYWLYGWKMNQLPGGNDSDLPPSDYILGEAPPLMFQCAIDGKKYDARLFKSIMVYEGNLDIFDAFVTEFRKPPQSEISA